MPKTYDEYLQRGLEGRELWNTIKHKCTSHNDILEEMRQRQKQLSVYSKAPMGEKINGIDRIQMSLLGDIRFLETMAWRVYMFGQRSLFSPLPGPGGELRKRQRTDPAYWKYRAQAIAKHGKAEGVKHADKFLKSRMREEWERTVLKRYKY